MVHIDISQFIDQLLLLGILLVLSAFFSSSETALFSLSTTRAKHLAKNGDAINRMIEKMRNEPHRLLSTILIGNNLVNIAASAIATSIAFDMFANNAVAVATFVMTIIILVFGEIFPKSLATRNNTFISRIVIYPLYWLSICFYPVIKLLDFIPLILGRFEKKPTVTEEELKTFVEVSQEEGEIDEEEKKLINNIFQFDDTSASEIMTPRADMYVLDIKNPSKTRDILTSGHTRIPVIEESIDDVIGIVNIKDLCREKITSGNDRVDIRKIMRRAYFMPESKKINTLLQHFQTRKQHISIVVDEHGGVSGLITLEDVLEELVGEISDETDPTEPEIVKTKPGRWEVPGKLDTEMVNEHIPMAVPDSAEYDTFSGFFLHHIGRIPQEGEHIMFRGHKIVVQEMDGNRIVSFVVTAP